jgi:acetyl-CoA C-acetyltransferase
MLNDVYLAGAARTPLGAFLGALSGVPAPRLGAIAVRESLARAGVPARAVDEVVMGNVVSAGLGQNVARQCAIGAGLPVSAGATSVNRVCGSGLKAVMMAAQAVQLGEAAAVVAGGAESMSRAPYLLERAREGYRLGSGELVDAMLRDGLTDAYGGFHMGTRGDVTARELGLSREDQDEYAVRSYRRAIEAADRGWSAAEIVPVEVPGKKGAVLVDKDEGPLRFDEEKLRKLPPAFGPGGTVTAGNASQISDGAAVVVVLSKGSLTELKVKPAARILGYTTFSREPEWFTTAPVDANRRLLKDLGLDAAKVDVFEINEAFAVVPMAVMRELSLPADKVNPLGGAISIGHPIGASGARVLITLLNALRIRKGRIGVASLCVGGGEAVALAVEMC